MHLYRHVVRTGSEASDVINDVICPKRYKPQYVLHGKLPGFLNTRSEASAQNVTSLQFTTKITNTYCCSHPTVTLATEDSDTHSLVGVPGRALTYSWLLGKSKQKFFGATFKHVPSVYFVDRAIDICMNDEI